MRAALDGLAEAVTVHDRDGRLIYVNEMAARTIGYASVEEALAMPPGAWAERFAVYHEDGREVLPSELPGRQAFAGLTPEPLIVRSVERQTRRTSWVRIQARPLFGA